MISFRYPIDSLHGFATVHVCRVKRRDAESKTRLRTLAEIGTPLSLNPDRQNSHSQPALINPWDEDQPTNVIVQNGTLVKVLGWHRQEILDRGNASLLYAHISACNNKKQQGMIRAGSVKVRGDRIVVCCSV